MSGLWALIRRDLRLALRQRGDLLTAVLFFLLTAALFPFGIGPEPNLLLRIAPGILWVTALLAVLLSLERLFLADWEDGSLDLLLLAPQPLEAMVLAKVLVHWLTSGLPILLSAPLAALLYGLPAHALPVLLLALALGTPSLSLLGATAAALTLGARRGGVLLPLLTMPLYIPVLVFGVAAVDASLAGFSVRPHLLLLGALLLVSLPVAALSGAAALRQTAE
ncbi:heme exporter protein B [Tistlia consotensis]|uniref:Heme exporter protein B n=1 Tax=Tistlia consotensis USBA 355 TaxID=560819 RepID=A0A1Y6BMY4_9PROT|nr:heme exporter protein CcmB [Tistlia consotensis]SMF11874.1 heme exporter protein B [Tistlia consotensis USBA 355]SNR51577.1 heme exporter protein B [Tistlia consotensis]